MAKQPAPRTTPEQEQSIAANLGGKAIGGLSAIGNALSLPGSMVLDTLALRNPLDQILTPFSPENRTTGRDLLRNYGLIGKKDTWSNFAPSMALEIATDPLTFLTGGSMALAGKSGKATKAIGLTDDIAKAATKKLGGVRPIGPREGRMTASLNDVIDNLPYTRKSSAMNALEEHAKTAGFRNAGDFLSRHGDEKLGGLAGWGLPLTGEISPLGTGETARKVAKTMDTAGRAVSNSWPGLIAKGLFHAPSGGHIMGSKSEVMKAQELSQGIHAARREEQVIARTKTRQLHEDLNSIVTATGMDRPTTERLVKTTAELIGRGGKSSFDEAVKLLSGSKIPLPVFTPEHRSMIETLATREHKQKNDLYDAIGALGGKNARIEDTDALTHMPRKVSPIGDSTFSERYQQQVVGGAKSFGNQLARNEERRHVPEHVLERIAKLSLTPDIKPAGKAERIVKHYSQFLDGPEIALHPSRIGDLKTPEAAAQYASSILPKVTRKGDIKKVEDLAVALVDHITTGTPLTAAMTKDATEFLRKGHAQTLAKMGNDLPETIQKSIIDDIESAKNAIVKLPPRPGATLNPAVNRVYDDFVSSQGAYYKGAHKILPNLDTLHEKVAEVASTTAGPNGVKLGDAMRSIGFANPEKAMEEVARRKGVTLDDAKKMFVDKDWVTAANKNIPREVKHDYASFLRGEAARATDVIKRNLTLPFPSFVARNLTSGALGMNTMANETGAAGDYAKLWDANKKAWDMRWNPAKNHARMNEVFDNDVTQYGRTLGDVSLGAMGKKHDIIPESFLKVGDTWDAAKAAVAANPTKLGPFKNNHVQLAADFGGQLLDKARVPYNFMMETGGKASAEAEFYNRVGMFNYLRDAKGMSPAAAAKRVEQVHVNYSDVTPFERDLKLAVPFYSFTRKVGEETAKTLTESPGGPMATAIKTINRSRRPSELTPDYVAETASIPLGENADGSNRYITGLGLAFEDPLSFLGKGIRGAGLEALSRTNPLIKGPLEYTTGTTFFQSSPDGGRPLGDADPLMGRLAANVTGRKDAYQFGQFPEAVIANSPASRYLSTARQLTDPRKNILAKAVNLLTGMKVTDVSPGSQDAILRERVQQELRDAGGRSFVRSYIPDSVKERMTPQQLQEARQYEGLLNTLADRAKKRKAELAAK